jgi:hypothetical protein
MRIGQGAAGLHLVVLVRINWGFYHASSLEPCNPRIGLLKREEVTASGTQRAVIGQEPWAKRIQHEREVMDLSLVAREGGNRQAHRVCPSRPVCLSGGNGPSSPNQLGKLRPATGKSSMSSV